MRQASPALASRPPRSDFEIAEKAMLTLWRTIWLDIPLAWACEIDRLLYPWLRPVNLGDCLFGLDAGHKERDGEVEDVKRE